MFSPRFQFAACALAVLLAAVVSSGCASDPAAPELREPPRPDNLDGIDAGVAAAIRGTLAKIEKEPDKIEHWAALAMVYHANELFSVAEATYDHLAEWRPEETRTWYYLAMVRYRQGNTEQAFEAIDRAIELNDTYAPLRWRRGEWQVEAGELEAAEADFHRAAEIAPGDPAPQQGLAKLYLARGDAERAVEILQPIVAADPEEPYGHLLLGNAYRQLGRMDEAQAELQKGQGERLVRTDPWIAEVKRLRLSFSGRVKTASDHLSEGRLEPAVAMFEQLRTERPDDVRVLTKLGLAYLKQGRTTDSMATLQDALERHPDHFNVHLQLASTYQLSGDPEQALAHVERAIELKPEYALSHARHAAILERGQRFDEAAEAYGRALAHSPGDPMLLRAQGDCYGRLKRWPDAAGAYQEALSLSPDDPDLLSRLGYAAFAMGRYDVSERALERALELGTSRPAEVNQLLEQVRRRREADAG